MKRQRRLVLDEWECDNGCGFTERVDKGATPSTAETPWWTLPCPPEWQPSTGAQRRPLTFHAEACLIAWLERLKERAHPVGMSVVPDGEGD